MISKYINQIRFRREWKKDYSDEYDLYTFYGDGEGDFETSSEEIANDEIVVSYIMYCKQQIEYAEKYLEKQNNLLDR